MIGLWPPDSGEQRAPEPTRSGPRFRTSRQRLSTRRALWAGANWAVLVLLLLVPPVFAQGGISLSWDDCGTTGLGAKTFACNTNVGSHVLVTSFAVSVAMDQLTNINAVLDLQTSGAELPDWWLLRNAGACRQSGLSASADFSSGPGACPNPWGGYANTGVQYQTAFGYPNRARILAIVYTVIDCVPVPANTEHMAFKLILSNEKTVGVDACAGCTDGVCIVLNSMILAQCNGPTVELTMPLNRSFVTWQGGIPDCPGATPVRNQTWGRMKTLYR